MTKLHRLYPFLNYVDLRQPCTRFYLEHFERGKYKDLVNECILKGYIVALGKNENGEDLYFITDKGKRYIDNPKEELL